MQYAPVTNLGVHLYYRNIIIYKPNVGLNFIKSIVRLFNDTPIIIMQCAHEYCYLYTNTHFDFCVLNTYDV